jgi:hypothetical protein
MLIKYGMRGGTEITLKNVKATTEEMGGGKIYTVADIRNPFIIQGINPSKSELLAEFGALLKGQKIESEIYAAIAWQESRFNQFLHDADLAVAHPNSRTPDYPLQGDDADDFGIMQINNPSEALSKEYDYDYNRDDMIWNWAVNVQQGKFIFLRAYNRSKIYNEDNAFKNIDPKPSPLDENQCLKEAYCEYNGGICKWYWDWVEGDIKQNDFGYWARIDDIDGVKVKKAVIDARVYADKVFSYRSSKPWNNIP